MIGIVAARSDLRPLSGIVDRRQARVVELQVGAAEVGERPHLGDVGSGDVRPKLVEVGVDVGIDRVAAASGIDHVE